jgi:hypothetical protein
LEGSDLPFVPVPKDLTKVKTKVALNLTKRQLICFSLAGAVGIPTYLLTKEAIGNSAAVLLMIGLMLPFFFMAMYEKDGQPAEKVLRNFLRVRFFFPGKRPYKTENLYAILAKEGKRVAQRKTAAAQATAARQTGKNRAR